ncbi:hypothetical protein N7523_010293 [Penicillium sp. IBT 18751x]|nr:hypothetical protein N7523_010293 [Penicillium sp. IBT 18751x]
MPRHPPLHTDIAIAISRRYFSNAKPFLHNVREDGTEVIADDEANEDAMDDAEQWSAMWPICSRAHHARGRDGIRTDDEPAAGDHGRAAGRVSDEQRALA